MNDLIEALQIMAKYEQPEYPTHCEHDVLYVFVNPELVSEGDIARLDELGFFINDDDVGFMSYKFGSC